VFIGLLPRHSGAALVAFLLKTRGSELVGNSFTTARANAVSAGSCAKPATLSASPLGYECMIAKRIVDDSDERLRFFQHPDRGSLDVPIARKDGISQQIIYYLLY
jgi:hypothetical protein